MDESGRGLAADSRRAPAAHRGDQRVPEKVRAKVAMRTVSLRRRLLLLAAAGILPLAAMSGIALWALVQQQRVQAEGAALELARALGTAVDAELRRSISVLEALAVSLHLDRGELGDYY